MHGNMLHVGSAGLVRKEKRKDYAFRRQLNEKPSVIPGCPDGLVTCLAYGPLFAAQPYSICLDNHHCKTQLWLCDLFGNFSMHVREEKKRLLFLASM